MESQKKVKCLSWLHSELPMGQNYGFGRIRSCPIGPKTFHSRHTKSSIVSTSTEFRSRSSLTALSFCMPSSSGADVPTDCTERAALRCFACTSIPSSEHRERCKWPTRKSLWPNLSDVGPPHPHSLFLILSTRFPSMHYHVFFFIKKSN